MIYVIYVVFCLSLELFSVIRVIIWLMLLRYFESPSPQSSVKTFIWITRSSSIVRNDGFFSLNKIQNCTHCKCKFAVKCTWCQTSYFFIIFTEKCSWKRVSLILNNQFLTGSRIVLLLVFSKQYIIYWLTVNDG